MLVPVFVNLEVSIDLCQLPKVVYVSRGTIVIANDVDDLFSLVVIGEVAQPLQGRRFGRLLIRKLTPFEIDNVATQDDQFSSVGCIIEFFHQSIDSRSLGEHVKVGCKDASHDFQKAVCLLG